MNYEANATAILKNVAPNDFANPDNINLYQSRWEDLFIILALFTEDNAKGIEAFDKLIQNNLQKTHFLTNPSIMPSILWSMIILGLRDTYTINRLFDSIFQYQKWFVENRDPYNKGIISIFHPWESGREFSPDWIDALDNIHLDKVDVIRKTPFKNNNTQIENVKYLMILEKMRELEWDSKDIYNNGLFNICDPTVQFIFLRSIKDLYKIAIYLNRTETYKTIENWIDLYSFGSNYLWNTRHNAYSVLNLNTNILFNGISCGSLLYSYADVGNNEQKEALYLHSKRIIHYSNNLFPHCYSNKADFQVKKYWNGPTWCLMNLLLIFGFKQCGKTVISDKIKQNLKHIIENNGFFEFINPTTCLGNGNENDIGTASIYLLLMNNLL